MTETPLDLTDLWNAVQEKYSAPHLKTVLAGIKANYERFQAAKGIGTALAKSYLVCKMKDANPAGSVEDSAFKVCRCEDGWFMETGHDGVERARRCHRCLGVPEPSHHEPPPEPERRVVPEPVTPPRESATPLADGWGEEPF